MEPLISVIVPIYNAKPYLPRCLDSILTQTYGHLEIILVDDGSTDGSGAVCDEYATRDDRIRVVHQTNVGIGNTRNTGLNLCTGEYLTFVDSDDYLYPDALRRLYDRLCADGSDLVIGNCTRVYEDGTCSDPYYPFTDRVVTRCELLEDIAVFGAVPFAPWGKLYRRSCMDGVTYPAVRIGEDTLAFPCILDRCARISVVSAPLYAYYQRDDSLMRERSEASKTGDVYALLHTARYLWDNGCYNGAANWYGAAAKNALCIRNRRDRLAEFEQFFDRKDRRTIRKYMDRKGRIAWQCLYIPRIDRLFRRMFSKG